MDDPLNTIQPQKKSGSAVDTLLIVFGVACMLLAFALAMFVLLRNNGPQMANAAAADEPFVYNGQQIHHVAAGAKQISALSYSSQAPVIVMFDADW